MEATHLGTTISDHIYHMRRYFRSGATLSLASRKRQLENLRDGLKKYEPQILAALKQDLGKSSFEGFATEIALVMDELRLALEKLDEWSSPLSVPTHLGAAPGSSKIYPQPRGVILIISPWNYPFQLSISPLIAALAAGNICVLKPSELSSATTAITVTILRECLSPDVVYCVEGDAAVSTELLKHAWDHVFFTGSTRVGKLVAKACAEHLTPFTLELGGKSPAIVDRDVNIKDAARKIAWGKFMNAGQTCIGVDYLLIHESVKDEFIAELKACIRKFYGEDPQKSPDYGRIINFSHYERLSALITSGTAIHGGKRDRADRYIEPTIIDGVTMDHPAMAEEIFGPILPVMTWREKGQLYPILEAHPNPLALYLFTKDKSFEEEIRTSIPFGGGCVNHTLLHISGTDMPFGGIRQSGIGSYHGKFGFDTFTHQKSIFKAGLVDLPLKYPKYKAWKFKLLRWLFRWP